MSIYQVCNLEEEMDEISDIINKKVKEGSREVWLINSVLGEKDTTIIKHKKLFHFVQFLPNQYNYFNMDKDTDGYIKKYMELYMFDTYDIKKSSIIFAPLKIWYKAK